MKKPFALALATLTVAACGGRVVVDASNSSGAGGAGGSPTETVSTSDGAPDPTTGPSSVVTVGFASSAVTTGSGMTCDPTLTCGAVVTDMGTDPTQLCDFAESAKLYNALLKCVCGGPCAMECGANICAGAMPSLPCQTCISDTKAGCGQEFNACINDI